ncbi:MAG: hypothetical protein OXI96_06065 [Acidimicrobiaceae bacterium]|nr:hypothetical protein [Acidimicrobiaceae bacterium]
MGRIEIELPDELHNALKELDISTSELLTDAARAEIRRRALLDETDRYLEEITQKVGDPTPEGLARAQALALRILNRDTDKLPL